MNIKKIATVATISLASTILLVQTPSLSTLAFTPSEIDVDVQQDGGIIRDLFPDENFARVIALNVNNNDNIDSFVEFERLNRIVWLNAQNSGIKSIEGIGYLTNLVTLRIENNEISDISPMQNLINLREILAHYNEISDLTPLQNLTNLVIVEFSYNQISDVTPLQNLSNVVGLTLRGNKIYDLSPLKDLNNLVIAQFSDQTITLEDVHVNQPTRLNIFDINGNLPQFTVDRELGFIGRDNLLVWFEEGNQTLTWTSENNGFRFSGTIKQNVLP